MYVSVLRAVLGLFSTEEVEGTEGTAVTCLVALRFVVVAVGVAFGGLRRLSVRETVESLETKTVLRKSLGEGFFVEVYGNEVEEDLLDKDDNGCGEESLRRCDISRTSSVRTEINDDTHLHDTVDDGPVRPRGLEDGTNDRESNPCP